VPIFLDFSSKRNRVLVESKLEGEFLSLTRFFIMMHLSWIFMSRYIYLVRVTRN